MGLIREKCEGSCDEIEQFATGLFVQLQLQGQAFNRGLKQVESILQIGDFRRQIGIGQSGFSAGQVFDPGCEPVGGDKQSIGQSPDLSTSRRDSVQS